MAGSRRTAGVAKLGGWRLTDFTEILDHVQARLDQFALKLETIAEGSIVAVCLPTLPLPPLQPTLPAWNAGAFDLQGFESVCMGSPRGWRRPPTSRSRAPNGWT